MNISTKKAALLLTVSMLISYGYLYMTRPNLNRPLGILIAFGLVFLVVWTLSLMICRLVYVPKKYELTVSLISATSLTVLLTLSSFRAAGLAEAALVAATISLLVWYFWIRLR